MPDLCADIEYPTAIIIRQNSDSAPLGVVGSSVTDAITADGNIRRKSHANHGAMNLFLSAEMPTINDPAITKFMPIMCVA